MEVLSPAGDFEQGMKAIESGANAIYGGLKAWNARARANNFTLDEYNEFITICHNQDVKFYLTINTLVTNKEIYKIIELFGSGEIIFPDAIIITDIGLFICLHELYPEIPLHISTQQGISSIEEAIFFERLGAERIILARELSLDKIKSIKESVNIEVEVFVYGAQCISYSGYCYWGFLANKGSGNRGSCSGPCRMVYVSEDNIRVQPFYADYMDNLEYILSLQKIGVSSLKIEGRLRKKEEIASEIARIKRVLSGANDVFPVYSAGFIERTSKIRPCNLKKDFTEVKGSKSKRNLFFKIRVQDENCIMEIYYSSIGILNRVNLSNASKLSHVTIEHIYECCLNIISNYEITFAAEKIPFSYEVNIDIGYLKYIFSTINNMHIMSNNDFLHEELCIENDVVFEVDNVETFTYLYKKGFREFVIDINDEKTLDDFLKLSSVGVFCIYRLPLLDTRYNINQILIKLCSQAIMVSKISQLGLLENMDKDKVYFDYTCNLYNSYIVDYLYNRGYHNFSASIEQSMEEISSVFKLKDISVQYVAGGLIPVGISAYNLSQNGEQMYKNILDGYKVYTRYNDYWGTTSIYTDLFFGMVDSKKDIKKRYIFSTLKVDQVKEYINKYPCIMSEVRLLYKN